jgi:hypothetical protein
MEEKNKRELSPDEMDKVSGGEDGSKEITAKDIEELENNLPHYKPIDIQPDIQPVKITKKIML